MIASITLNPSLDKTIYVSGLTVGDTNRVLKAEVDAGGKGINASRMLAKLGAETVALGFIGGKTGRFIQHILTEDGIKCDFIHTIADTRTNIGVEDASGPPTTLNEKGGPITPEELDKLMDHVRHWAKKSKMMILGGSIPMGIEPTIYRDMIEVAQAEGAKVILDADGEPLGHGLTARPFMIKPNLVEAQRFCGRELITVDCIADAAQSILEKGVEIVVISMGKHGAIAANRDEVWQAVPPDVKVISTVGAGDSMVAGIAHSICLGRHLSEGLALGSASGSATAMSDGSEMGKKADIDTILPLVKLKRLR